MTEMYLLIIVLLAIGAEVNMLMYFKNKSPRLRQQDTEKKRSTKTR